MNAKPFLDTNVVLYAFRQGDSRSQKAEALLAEGGAISVQVLNEFVAVARRKLNKSWEEVSSRSRHLARFLFRAYARNRQNPRHCHIDCGALQVFDL